MSASVEQVRTDGMTSDEASFCDYLNEDLKSRGLDARFNYVKRKGAGFDFDLSENISGERYLDVFDGLTASGWTRFHGRD